ncbi:MAG: NAD(+)/NADH kinase [Candidatus Bathyarchaeota archaeon]|nr:NAD(+)/NADH kinase [Candidatus Bathyarchaeota archaeon]
MTFNTIGIVPRLDNKYALDLSYKIYQYLKKHNLKVVPDEDFAKKFALKNSSSLSKMDVDLIITVGGDGTVLKTCMNIPKPETPILTINMGRRGILTEVGPKDAIEAIKKCIAGDFNLEKHNKLSIMLGNEKIVDGLNEVLMASIMPWKMIDFEVALDGNFFLKSRADALIIATSTGSTAHALSAGGPIVHASLNAFVLIFLCPLEHISPIVIPSKNTIEVISKNPKMKTFVTVDGRYQRWIEPEQKLTVKKSDKKAVFIRIEKSFTYKNLFRTLNPLKGGNLEYNE